MNNFSRFSFMALLAAAAGTMSTASAETLPAKGTPSISPTKVAFVDLEGILEKSEEYHDDMAKLQKEYENHKKYFAELDEKQRKLEAKLENASEMTEEAQKKTIIEITNIKSTAQVEAKVAEQNITRKAQELQRKHYNEIKKIATDIGRKLGYQAVTPAFIVLDPEVDITAKVIEEANKKFTARQKREKEKRDKEQEGQKAAKAA